MALSVACKAWENFSWVLYAGNYHDEIGTFATFFSLLEGPLLAYSVEE